MPPPLLAPAHALRARTLCAPRVARLLAPCLQDKFRHVKTSNPKIHERLIRPTGGELFMLACGWRRAGDALSLPAGTGAEAMASAVAELGRQAEAAKKERAEAEREKLRVEREAVRATRGSRRDVRPEPAPTVRPRPRPRRCAAHARRSQAMRAKREEKERLRAAMEADRREISARGPSQAIKASKLPSGGGGLAVNRLNLEEDPEDNRPA